MTELITTKPFASRRQQRWAFARKMPFARRWAKQTDFASLPASKDVGTEAGAPLHGPGGLLATPGMGTRRKQWGVKLKAANYSARAGQTIVGNLGRSADGKFTRAGGASTATPARGVQYSKPTKITAPKAPSAPKGGGKGKKGGGGKGRVAAKPKPTPAQAQRDQERAADRAQRQQDREQRLQRQTARDQEHATDRQRREQERTQAAADKLKKQQAAQSAKPAKGGGGGGAKKQPKQTTEQRQQQQAAERTQRANQTASAVGLTLPDVDALRQGAEAGGARSEALTRLGLLGADGMTTDQGRRALSALERGDVRGYQAALQDARARLQREQQASGRRSEAATRQQQAAAAQQRRLQATADRIKRGGRASAGELQQLVNAGLATNAGGMVRLKAAASPSDYLVVADRTKPSTWHLQVKRNGKSDHRLMGAAWAALHGGYRGNPYAGPDKGKALDKLQALYRAEKLDMPAEKSAAVFAVFKDDTDAYRWVARTTTAYRDRDGEIITTRALEADAARMQATGQYGPLRYWHVGAPDPAHAAAPWGPGLDIGDCDYSTVIGRTSIESGTFKSHAIGRAFAASAADYELSPGFFHAPTEPNAAGEYHAIRRFERSAVPIKHARASNLFTGLTVKEHRMDQATYEARVKAFLADMNAKGVPEQVAATALAGMAQADKSAADQGVAYKSDDAPAVYTAPDGTPGLIVDGRFIALKAAAPMEGTPAEEALETPDEEDAEMAAGMGDNMGDMAMDDVIGNLTWDAFAAKLAAVLAPVLKIQDMVKAVGDHAAELKTMYGGVATKDAGVAAELAALKAQQADLAAKIAAIEGDQPTTVLPDDVAAALKSAGPTAPPDQSRPDVPNDPNRPWAGWGAMTFPELYGGTPPTAGN